MVFSIVMALKSVHITFGTSPSVWACQFFLWIWFITDFVGVLTAMWYLECIVDETIARFAISPAVVLLFVLIHTSDLLGLDKGSYLATTHHNLLTLLPLARDWTALLCVWIWSVAHLHPQVTAILSPYVVSLVVVVTFTLVPTLISRVFLLLPDAVDVLGLVDSDLTCTIHVKDSALLSCITWAHWLMLFVFIEAHLEPS